MSESRRYAKLIGSIRERPFDSKHSLAASIQRVAAAFADDDPAVDERRVVIEKPSVVYVGHWTEAPSGIRLEGRFEPTLRTRMTPPILSIMALVLFYGSFRALTAQSEDPARYLVVVVTAIFALFGMPMMIYGTGSVREGDEAMIERAMRVALEDLDPKMPPPQKWSDED